MKLEKKYKEFTSAYEYQFGEKWKWEIDGKENHPAFSNNEQVRMFWNGWRLAKKGQEFYREKLKYLERLEKEINQIKESLL